MSDILNRNTGLGVFVNVMGLVKDCRLPMTIKPGQVKTTLKLYDISLQDDYATLALHVFGKNREEMPVVSAADVVLIRQAKVQDYGGVRSIVTNFSTTICVYAATKIPLEPELPTSARRPPTWNPTQSKKPSTPEESKYVSWLFHHIQKTVILEPVEFAIEAAKTLNIADKFSTLKDVTDGKFYNLIARVAHKPLPIHDYVTLWITDYTENTRFQDFDVPDGKPGQSTQVGDAHGYLNNSTANVSSKLLSDWTGPRGKMSMQVTCYEPHASYIRDYVTASNWVELGNVQVKMGRNGAYLEGFMRDDHAYGSPIRVSCIEVNPGDRDSIDPRHKAALRRYRDYKVQCKVMSQKKRKADGEPAQNKKQNRAKEQRGLLRSKQFGTNAPGDDGNGQLPEGMMAPNLNSSIVSENQHRAITRLADALEPFCCQTDTADQKAAGLLPLPFVNVKFRAQVRVVDFRPSRLESFAVGRRPHVLDILSDYERDTDTGDSNEDRATQPGASGRARVPLVWEWRFALLLEDATPSATPSATPPARIWTVVDNAGAQMLTGLNACDLRCNVDALDALREKMFVLWGDLEEKKRLQLRAKREAEVAAAAQRQKGEQKKREEQKKKQQQQKQRAQNAKPGQTFLPPQDSSDDEWHDSQKGRQKPDTAQQPQTELPSRPVEDDDISKTVSNRPFVCCVWQYGAKDAGDENSNGKRTWKRMFALFGTKISGS
ncbi:telomere-binding alpha subunit central domain containing protein [Grosmannia clavigera kw1407]|uniref:Protection of telomeres protein 1 n=1 Tax=Grosmannia clavigera (strain kw1407 / UAMH 11150) TaxID=655863 RepID=F0XLN0_GROCL|nr:telomere-binding alpha subunit central domain containing protein [Grosmannia clavigera kw1407]EFX00992.1 telomere-binding alpha subunit central domain containing protein [Grosmannia clavigera kw1407]